MFKHPLSLSAIGIILGYAFVSISIPINYPYGYIDSLWPVVVGMLLATFFLSNAHAIQQAHQIDIQQKAPKHGRLFLLRSLATLVIVLPIHGFNNKTLVLAAMMGAGFWIAFDALLNYYRGKAIFYVTRYYTAAVSDRLQRLVGNPYLMLYLKIKVLAFTIWYYLV